MPSDTCSRRHFLIASGLAGAGTLLQPRRLRAAAGEKVRVGFVGIGNRGFGAHVKTLSAMAANGAPIELAAICDVYDEYRDRATSYIKENNGYEPDSYLDFREMFEQANLDAVCIGTPDHWHAVQAIEAMQAGLHVYCEKPMVKTVEEAIELVRVWNESGTVMQVGVQSTSLPVWDHAREQINDGLIGKVLMYQTEYFRNSNIGQWRNYKLTPQMTPDTIDWQRFLGVEEGLSEDRPFDRAIFAQWRRFWPYGSGMFTDLFVHRTTTMLKATGLRYPARVTGAGGIFVEYDGRQVPDVATVVADFAEGVQGLVTATMAASETPIRQLIRGHHGSLVFGGGANSTEYEFVPERPQVTGISPRDVPYEPRMIRPDVPKVGKLNRAHFENWIAAIEAGDPQACNNPPDLGAAAVILVNLGARSYREGKIYRFDDQSMTVSEADGSWSDDWEKRSAERGQASHVPGWNAGEQGSTLVDPEHQYLEGPWIDGVDPAAAK